MPDPTEAAAVPPVRTCPRCGRADFFRKASMFGAPIDRAVDDRLVMSRCACRCGHTWEETIPPHGGLT